MKFFLILLLSALACTAQAVDWLYVTAPGDTLIGIGKRYLTNPNDWPRIRVLNRVANPRRLPTNSQLRIPVELLKVTPAPAKVSHVEGNVRMKPEGSGYKKLAVGDNLTGGETVISGPRSFASYTLADGSKLSQAASTKLIFGRLAAYGATGMVSTELTLESGRMEADASKQTFPGTGFRINTPVAVAGLRGTRFRLNMDESGKMLRNEVLEGAVGVSAQNQEALVGAGFGTRAEAGKPPEPPRLLLPAPALDHAPSKLLESSARFAWAAMTGARAWRAQVARDTEFRDVVLDDQVQQPALHLPDTLPDGHYVLRLRSVDETGLEGLNTDHPFELAVKPLPPQPILPVDGSISATGKVTVSWQASPEANGYALRLARDANFTQAVELHRIDQGTQKALELTEGTYFWRLASLDSSGAPHGWGGSHSFMVQEPLPQPTQTRARMQDGALAISWQGSAPAYRIEIAANPEFKDIVASHWLTSNQVHLSKPKAGNYWLRVVPLGKQDQRGPEGKAVQVHVSEFR